MLIRNQISCLLNIRFVNKEQSPTETVGEFITEIQLVAKDCEFHEKHEIVRDRIVLGTNSDNVREKS
jgi:hypothetical protein